MPKISIREIDTTGQETFEYNDYTVLIPGVYLTYKDSAGNDIVFGEEKDVFSAISDFSHDFVNAPLNYEQDTGFLMAYELVKRGLTVKYKGAYNYKDGKVEDNAVKDYITYVEPITGETKSLTAEMIYEEFADRSYDLRFITIGGLPDVVEASLRAMVCAGNRGDAIAILDVPAKGEIEIVSESGESGETELINVKLDNAYLIDAWVQQNFKAQAMTEIERKGVSWKVSDVEPETYGRYAAMFAPRVNIQFSIKDPATKLTSLKYLNLPTSFDYLACFGQQVKNYPAWFATAGSVRGVSPYNTLIPTVEFKDADIDILQPRSLWTSSTGEEEGLNHLATNVVCKQRPFGYVIWGNRTLHPLSAPLNTPSAPVQLTASSFLNIRNLCCSLKKTIYRAAKKYTFDPNSDALWYNFKGAITPLLDEMKANQGIRGYQIVKVSTKKKALLVARIIITPIEAVEDFDIDVVLADNVEVAE